jgi:hypothetical protein
VLAVQGTIPQSPRGDRRSHTWTCDGAEDRKWNRVILRMNAVNKRSLWCDERPILEYAFQASHVLQVLFPCPAPNHRILAAKNSSVIRSCHVHNIAIAQYL